MLSDLSCARALHVVETVTQTVEYLEARIQRAGGLRYRWRVAPCCRRRSYRADVNDSTTPCHAVTPRAGRDGACSTALTAANCRHDTPCIDGVHGRVRRCRPRRTPCSSGAAGHACICCPLHNLCNSCARGHDRRCSRRHTLCNGSDHAHAHRSLPRRTPCSSGAADHACTARVALPALLPCRCRPPHRHCRHTAPRRALNDALLLQRARRHWPQPLPPPPQLQRQHRLHGRCPLHPCPLGWAQRQHPAAAGALSPSTVVATAAAELA